MNSIAILGTGAWGTALAITAFRAGAAVTLCGRDPSRIAALAASRIHPRLPGAGLPGGIIVSDTIPEEVAAIVLAVPMQHLRASLARVPEGATPLIACAKGVEAGSLLLPLEVIAELRPATSAAVLTGPNFAAEIAAGLPAAAVVAAADHALRRRLIEAFATPAFRLYGNDDPVGAQVGGAAKNVIAIAAGAVIGAGLGENARAALVTRGLAELARLAPALGGRAETVAGLSGLGDLLLTCTGPVSRNFSLGMALGQGERLPNALAASHGVVEGVATAPALAARARHAGLELPICDAVDDLLAERVTLRGAIERLLGRRLRDE